MNRIYFSIEFNFRDKDGNPVDMEPNMNTSLQKNNEYAGHCHDFWHAGGHHMVGTESDVATDIECTLDGREDYGLMDRVHISMPSIKETTTVPRQRKLEIWEASDNGYAVVDVTFPPYHNNFLVVGFNSLDEAHREYLTAEFNNNCHFDWKEHADSQGHPFGDKEQIMISEAQLTEEKIKELDQQLIAYAMYYLGNNDNGKLVEDLNDGYPLYTAYNIAQEVADLIPLEKKKYMIDNDDLDPNVVGRAIDEVVNRPKLSKEELLDRYAETTYCSMGHDECEAFITDVIKERLANATATELIKIIKDEGMARILNEEW